MKSMVSQKTPESGGWMMTPALAWLVVPHPMK